MLLGNVPYFINPKPSGNHAIRKTCISELHDSQLLPDRMISDFAGHKDISTTQRYYIHSVTPLVDKSDVLLKFWEQKLCNKKAKEKSLEKSRLFLKKLMRKMGLELIAT